MGAALTSLANEAYATSPAALRAVAILDIILRDEIGHVAIGNQWYGWLCQQHGLDPLAHYRVLARTHSAPRLRPPLKRRCSQGTSPAVSRQRGSQILLAILRGFWPDACRPAPFSIHRQVSTRKPMATSSKAKKRTVRLASGRKRARQDVKLNAHNSSLRSQFRTVVKNIQKAVASGDSGKATELFKNGQRVIDSVADLPALLDL
jgi:small subunit ribosomal protein S20